MHIAFLVVGGVGGGICILRGVGTLWLSQDVLGVLYLGGGKILSLNVDIRVAT